MSTNYTFSSLGLEPSFGFGDRLGVATPGHIEAMRRAGSHLRPIFAQQSIREMKRTSRTPLEVVNAAQAGISQCQWNAASGADADHLKTTADVDVTSAVGFTFYTIDPSDFVDAQADDYEPAVLKERFDAVRDTTPWYKAYIGVRLPLNDGTPAIIDESACMRCAVKYGRAIKHALSLAEYIRETGNRLGKEFEIELSIDETPQPTSLAEHYIIADQFRQAALPLVSLAPRFVGDFEKGVDFKGDLGEFERSLIQHAALADELGPYKLSLHSGSDKLSLYPILANVTHGRFHVKTAGTSYLEALRVVAKHDASLFRQIIDLARKHYDRDKATYHVSATLNSLPSTAEVSDIAELERIYLERWSDVAAGCGFTEPGRQVLHCTFGTILVDPEVGPQLRQVLNAHLDTYTEFLADHFERHLVALKSAL